MPRDSANAGRRRLDAVVRERHGLSWNQARDRIASRKIWLDGAPLTDPGELVEPDAPWELRMNAPREAPLPTSAPLVIIHQDTQIVVVDKPTGLSTVPYSAPGAGRTDDSLEECVRRHLGGARVHVVHRLDRETSGLVVLARTELAARGLAQQFRRHSVHRRYLALARGDVAPATIRSFLVEDRGDGRRGSLAPREGRPVTDAKEAITHVAPLERFAGAATLVECRLETGRTHQIRIHLSEAGHPLLGDRHYLPRELPGAELPAPRVMLHAAELGLEHPTRGTALRWAAEAPVDFRDLRRSLALISPNRR